MCHSGKESACQCWRHKRCGFNPWVGKIPWSKKWQPTPVFLPGKFYGQRTWWATILGVTKSDTTEHTYTHTHTHTYTHTIHSHTHILVSGLFKLFLL